MQVNDNKQEYEPLSTKCLKSKKVSALVYKSLVRKKVKLQGIEIGRASCRERV